MRKLTEEEIAMVWGGDAAATRQRGQNSWGEGSFAQSFHYSNVAAMAGFGMLADRLWEQCWNLEVPWISCQQAALMDRFAEASGAFNDRVFNAVQ